MDMDFTLCLTDEQKENIGKNLTAKILMSIETMDFTEMLYTEVATLLEDGALMEFIDFKPIAEELTKKIIQFLKGE
jgi:uncharacterized membrane protein